MVMMKLTVVNIDIEVTGAGQSGQYTIVLSGALETMAEKSAPTCIEYKGY